jgi:O-antigen ligase
VAVKSREKRDWAFTWTLLFTAVLFLRPQDLFPPLESLHLAELTAIAGLGSLIMGRLGRRQSITRLTPDLIGVVAFGAVILVTAPFSIWFGGSFHVFQELYSKVILVYLLAVNVISSPKRLERLTWVLVLSVGYIGFRAVLDYARGVNMVGHGTRVQGSVGGIMQNPNDLALNMVAFLPLAAFIALRPDAGLMKRALAALCGAFMMGAIVASGSRGGFLGFACMVFVMALFALRQRPGLVIAGALAAMCALPLLPSAYWHRISSITDPSKDDFGSEDARRTLLAESLQAFEENPLTGVGAGEFKDWNPTKRDQAWHESHNVILQVAAELGVIGLAVFLFLIARAFAGVIQTRRLLRRARPARAPWYLARTAAAAPPAEPALPHEETTLLDAHSAAMAASLVGWFVCALFASVAYNWTFYYLLALAATPREMLRDRLPLPSRVRGVEHIAFPEAVHS